MKKLTIIRRKLELCDQIIHISEQRVVSEVKKVIYHDKVDRIQSVYVPNRRALKFTKEKWIKLQGEIVVRTPQLRQDILTPCLNN